MLAESKRNSDERRCADIARPSKAARGPAPTPGWTAPGWACEGPRVCARQSWHRLAGASPVRGNRDEVGTAMCCAPRSSSRYRVLRGLSRGSLRSVDRECAGRNASCVKGSSPVKHPVPWWPSKYLAAKATSTEIQTVDTIGVIDHGMYTQSVSEPGRSPRGGVQVRQDSLGAGQGLETKLATSARGEVRSRHSSEEVG